MNGGIFFGISDFFLIIWIIVAANKDSLHFFLFFSVVVFLTEQQI